jgi:hypothetical protein
MRDRVQKLRAETTAVRRLAGCSTRPRSQTRQGVWAGHVFSEPLGRSFGGNRKF